MDFQRRISFASFSLSLKGGQSEGEQFSGGAANTAYAWFPNCNLESDSKIFFKLSQFAWFISLNAFR